MPVQRAELHNLIRKESRQSVVVETLSQLTVVGRVQNMKSPLQLGIRRQLAFEEPEEVTNEDVVHGDSTQVGFLDTFAALGEDDDLWLCSLTSNVPLQHLAHGNLKFASHRSRHHYKE